MVVGDGCSSSGINVNRDLSEWHERHAILLLSKAKVGSSKGQSWSILPLFVDLCRVRLSKASSCLSNGLVPAFWKKPILAEYEE
ncbi:hypothetical protein AXF42_Ash005553 [Apostasia shenzhenica]|uniref:Uncharacterized protein n=1 Tax=Apostasia shenzhenica TaxID=1088818 RepID=A0A2I0B780_9ASPA|nr:hypothetical protein AXF42_Ash005553 [Apostasia shenzhenica]